MRRRIATLSNQGAKPLLEELPVCSSWALNTYTQCEFRCVYCITAAQGASTPMYRREEIRPLLRKELEPIEPEAHIAVGSLRDAYPWVETDHCVTRPAIEELVAQQRVFTIITKGTTVFREHDLLAGYAAGDVRMSVCTVDERALRRVDPKAPCAAQRLAVVEKLHAAGVQVSVSAEPWIPSVSDAVALLERVDDAIPVRFAPLNVIGAMVMDTPYARRFRQAEINAAYLREFDRVGPRPNVTWIRPISVEGSEPEHHPFAEM
jgi:DNA repair photolyase